MERTVEILDSCFVFSRIPKRKRDSHKGDYGRAAIVAGSLEYTGAAYLAAAACLRAGAGYTTLCVPNDILPYYILKAPEALLKSTNEGGRYAFNESFMQELLAYDSVAYGMGMGVSNDVQQGAIYLLRNYTGKLILDADGLNSLAMLDKAEMERIFQNRKCDVILTPHAKEFSRLSGVSLQEILQDSAQAAKNFAQKSGVSVLLKGARSVITDGARVAVNTAGCSGQAKGGSGDVLSGVIAGLCAMGATAFDGGCAGAFIAGKAAEIACAHTGEYSLTATDVIHSLGKAFLFVAENAHEHGAEQ